MLKFEELDLWKRSSGLPPQEAPVMIAKRRRLFFSVEEVRASAYFSQQQ